MDQVVPKCKGINTNQDAFNKVWNHFITNRHGPGTSDSGVCVTYDPTRPYARCALGIMATPKECQSELDLSNAKKFCPSSVVYDTEFIEGVLRERGVTIGYKLQQCHDSSSNISRSEHHKGSFIDIMRTKMTELAEEFDLEVPSMQPSRLTWEKVDSDGDKWRGDARLYKLSRPIPFTHLEEDTEPDTVDHVIVSAINNEFGTETYIFPANADGTTINMLEMSGSFKGGMDHERALNGLADSLN